jgi:D-amino peptidase
LKVCIVTDIEGVCGVVLYEQCIPGNKEYEEARYLLVKEVNAAVEGVLEGGADEVLVWDGHGRQFNFPLEELHLEAQYVLGGFPRSKVINFVDSSFDISFMLGHHAMANTEDAVRDHSFSSARIERITVNGIEMGEIGINALKLGYYDIPVALVTGDDKACAEAGRFLENVETVTVKKGLGRHCAVCLSPKKARQLIKKAACETVRKSGRFKPFRMTPPYTVEVDYLSTDFAEARHVDGVDRIKAGPRKVVYRTDNPLKLTNY